MAVYNAGNCKVWSRICNASHNQVTNNRCLLIVRMYINLMAAIPYSRQHLTLPQRMPSAPSVNDWGEYNNHLFLGRQTWHVADWTYHDQRLAHLFAHWILSNTHFINNLNTSIGNNDVHDTAVCFCLQILTETWFEHTNPICLMDINNHSMTKTKHDVIITSTISSFHLR